jgi:hypothetical protein
MPSATDAAPAVGLVNRVQWLPVLLLLPVATAATADLCLLARKHVMQQTAISSQLPTSH